MSAKPGHDARQPVVDEHEGEDQRDPERPARTVWIRNCAPSVALIVSLDRAL